ncbi:MAG TPA: hypothetical protein VIU11_02620 [Nakamurella sp.]
MRGRRTITLLTVLAAAATLALTGSMVGPVASSDASPGRSQWRADLDAASTAIPSIAQTSVQTLDQSLIRSRASNSKATAVAVAMTTNCDGCTGEAGTLQVVYFDGRGPVAADNVANAVSQCPDCDGPVVATAVSVQVVFVKRADQVTVNNRALAANVLCGPQDGGPVSEEICTSSAAAYQFVVIGGNRRDLTASAKDTIGQLQDVLAGELATAAQAPQAQAQASAEAQTSSIADQLQAVLVNDTGSTQVQRYVDVQVG